MGVASFSALVLLQVGFHRVSGKSFWSVVVRGHFDVDEVHGRVCEILC